MTVDGAGRTFSSTYHHALEGAATMIPFSPTGIAEDAVQDRSRRAIARADQHRLGALAVRAQRATGDGGAGRIRQAVGRRVVGLGMWIGRLGSTAPVLEKH